MSEVEIIIPAFILVALALALILYRPRTTAIRNQVFEEKVFTRKDLINKWYLSCEFIRCKFTAEEGTFIGCVFRDCQGVPWL